MTNFADFLESKQFLQWIGLPSDCQTKTLVVWYESIRQVAYHFSKVTQNSEAKLLPSVYGANIGLRLTTYVAKFAYSIREERCSVLKNHANYGWNDTESGFEIAWHKMISIANHNPTKCTQHRDVKKWLYRKVFLLFKLCAMLSKMYSHRLSKPT